MIGGIKYNLFAVYTYGRVEIYFQHLMSKPPFEDIELRRELRTRLNKVADVNLAEDVLSKRPSISLDTLGTEKSQADFIAVLDWTIEEIHRHHDEGTYSPK